MKKKGSGSADSPGSKPTLAECAADSPCTGYCVLDGQDVCEGCGRTIEEIVTWSSLDAASRREVLERLAREKETGSRSSE
ncbi:MAG: DUF1289 domain-containing protein [Desulfarculaceae bacterium]|nr:DUF1289 domain-containing protein [Desulfarculaceae bacterium]